MGQLSYSALDVAIILYKKELGIKDEMKFLSEFWNISKRFLQWKYQSNKRKFILDVQYCIHYLDDKEEFDCEFSKIIIETQKLGTILNEGEYIYELDEIDILFKELYIDLSYFSKTKYIRKSMRQMLKKYHLKKRTQRILDKFEKYIRFYELQMIVNRRKISDIGKIPLDERITFKLKN